MSLYLQAQGGGQGVAHQLSEILQQRFHLYRMRSQGLLAGKSQQTLGQQRTALGGIERAGDTWGITGVGIGQLQATDYHRQQVVEIMCQPARQLTNGLHLLTVQQRLLQSLTLDAVDLHLGGFLFQQTGGVLQRGGIAGKDVKRASQLSQLITPLQRGHRNVLLAVGKTRHRPGDRRQVGAQIAVDIPAGATGDDQRQYGEYADKHADGPQLLMTLGRTQPGSLRHLLNVLIDIAV